MSKIQKIGILSAMEEELEPILKHFNISDVIEYAKNKFYIAKSKDNKELIITHSKIGKVYSALMASIMIEKFKIEKMLFSGVAGSIDKSLKIGDIVVGKSLYQHDLDISAFGHPVGYVPGGMLKTLSNKDLLELAKYVSKKNKIDLKVVDIASGDQFLDNILIKTKVAKEFGAKAIDMESASVGVVCSSLDKDFLIVRTISDNYESKDTLEDFNTFLEKASIKSANLISSIVDKL